MLIIPHFSLSYDDSSGIGDDVIITWDDVGTDFYQLELHYNWKDANDSVHYVMLDTFIIGDSLLLPGSTFPMME